MFTYVPNTINAVDSKEWKVLMRRTIEQVLGYPNYTRPICDLAVLGLQTDEFYIHKKDEEGMIDITFGDNYVLFEREENKYENYYNILAGRQTENFLAEIQVRGRIDHASGKNNIHFRQVTFGVPEIIKDDLEFKEITEQITSRSKLSVDDVHAHPSGLVTDLERMSDFFDGLFW